MINATLKVLTPVHVGSGRQLQGNAECLYFQGAKKLAVVDEEKIFSIIGKEQIDTWVNYIENPSSTFLDYLHQRKPDIRPEDIASRVIPLKGAMEPQPHHPLREQIRTGFGHPYIPGSSLKGALRTAIFATTLEQRNESIGERLLKNKHDKFKDQTLQQEVFGKDPNHDWLRLLQVGDFNFTDVNTHAAFCESLNYYGRDEYRMKDLIRVLIEYIPAGAEAKGDIRIPDNQQKACAKMRHFSKGWSRDLHADNLNLPDLFRLVNEHNKSLLEREIERYDNADLPEQVDEMIPELEALLAQFATLGDNECMLRFGFGTGYKTMTGDWVSNPDLIDGHLYDQISAAARKTPKYNDFYLPKTRRVILGGLQMGWVKIIVEL